MTDGIEYHPSLRIAAVTAALKRIKCGFAPRTAVRRRSQAENRAEVGGSARESGAVDAARAVQPESRGRRTTIRAAFEFVQRRRDPGATGSGRRNNFVNRSCRSRAASIHHAKEFAV